MQLLSCWPPVQVHGFHHGAELHSAAVSPDGKFLGTAGADGQVRLGPVGGRGTEKAEMVGWMMVICGLIMFFMGVNGVET
jgi:hypothetical protein